MLQNVSYVDPAKGITLDDSTIVVRFKIHLPTGWTERDFDSVGKHWHIKECQQYEGPQKSIFVTFNKVGDKIIVPTDFALISLNIFY